MNDDEVRCMQGVTSLRMARLALAACALVAAAGRAHGDVFNYLAAPVDVTPAVTGSWTPVDVSANVPAGATGVILQMHNPSATTYHYGVRKNGSTDGWMVSTQATALAGCIAFYMIGVDANRIFECYTGNAAVKTYLLGYTMSGVTFFTNALDKSENTTFNHPTYQNRDISADTGADTAIGALFVVKNTTGTAKYCGLRKNGSSDDLYERLMAGHASVVLVGVDSSEICQMAVFDNTVDAYLVGYVIRGAVFYTNAVLYATNPNGTYQDSDITSNIAASDDANGALIEFYASSGYSVGIRPNGASHDYYGYHELGGGLSAIDSGDIFEQKVGNNAMDIYVVGYTVSSVINYRSVGTNTGNIYTTGNCSIAANTGTVTFGGGASLPSNVGQGDKLTIGSAVYHIYSRDSATQVRIQEIALAALTNQAYTITRAYNDFATWESARQGDLTLEPNYTEVAVAYNDGVFTPGATITIDGSTTDSASYMVITVASGHRHAGIGGAGVALDSNNTGSYHGLQISDDYTRVEWLQFKSYGGAAGRAAVKVDASSVLLDKVIIYDFNTGHTNKATRCTSGSMTIRNSVVYNGSDGGIRSQSGVITAQNCTVYGMTANGFLMGASSITATNCISMGNGANDFNGAITQSYNMSSDATAAGTGSLINKDAGNQFVSIVPGSEDLHLKNGADAFNVGTDLSGSFTDDIEGDLRPAGAAWDMGADERTGSSTNYRSVGTTVGTIYSTGVASISSASSTVTFGGGASLPVNVGPGDKLTIGATIFYLLSRDSSTQATVQISAGATLTNQAYSITRAYNDFAGWEAARQGNLVSELRSETAVAYDDGDFTSAVTIDGSTTDATHRMEITVASGQRHAGISGVGAVIDMNDAGTAITVSDNYTVVKWLQIRRTGGAAVRAGVCASNATNVELDSLLVYNFNGATCYGLEFANGSGGTVRNCVVYDGTGWGISGADIASVSVSNCTVFGIAGKGVTQTVGPMNVTNTMAMGCTSADFSSSGTMTQSYNLSSDGTAAGTGSLVNQTAGNQVASISSGNVNLHLKAGSAAIDAGADLSASFTLDIDNGTRVLPWDMGADDRSAYGTGQKQTPRVAEWYEAAP